MEHIQGIREIVEKLAGDEKMDDGQYLEVMNRLKSLYEREEEKKQPAIRADWAMEFSSGDVPVFRLPDGEQIAENTRNLSRIFLRHHFVGLSSDDIPDSPEHHTAVEELSHGLVDNTIATHSLEGITDVVLFIILRRGVGIWLDVEKREALLSNPLVRAKWLNEGLASRTYHMRKKIRKAYKTEGMTENDWTDLLSHIGVPLYTTMRKKRNGEFVPRDPQQLQKYHPITLSLSIPNHPIEMTLYTDKIQLGRTYLSPPLCYVMLEITHAERWYDVALEGMIDGAIEGMSAYYPLDYPKMVVSGITAQTRDKLRSYVCAKGLIRLTYQTKYSK